VLRISPLRQPGRTHRVKQPFVDSELLLSIGPASAAVLSAGSGASRTHGFVHAAINALPAGGAHEIRIRGGTCNAQSTDISSRVLRLIGGYANSTDAASTGSTPLNGDRGGPDSVITMTGDVTFASGFES